MKKMIPILALIITVSGYAGTAVGLTVELEKIPVGLDTARPRFSWKMKPEEGARGQMQTAYRLILGTDPEAVSKGKGEVFDSGKVTSDACVLVDVLPNDLQEATDYYWTVQLWDESGTPGGFAPSAKFDTGYFDQSFWNKDGAKWIESPLVKRDTQAVEDWIRYTCVNLRGALGGEKNGSQYDRYKDLVTEEEIKKFAQYMGDMMRQQIQPASLLRKEFPAGNITKARLYICGLGFYRAYLNGEMVGDRVLAPSDSDFDANTYYNVYDVTDDIKDGIENCLGVELVNGRWWSTPGCQPQRYYKHPVLIARLELTDSEGKMSTIGSFLKLEKWPHRDRINNILLNVPNTIPNAACANTLDITGHIGDAVHFNSQSQRQIGVRMANEYLILRSVPTARQEP